MIPIKQFLDARETPYGAAPALHKEGYPYYDVFMNGIDPVSYRSEHLKNGLASIGPEHFTWVGDTAFFTSDEHKARYIIRCIVSPHVHGVKQRYVIGITNVNDRFIKPFEITQMIGRRINKLIDNRWFMTNSADEFTILRLKFPDLFYIDTEQFIDVE